MPKTSLAVLVASLAVLPAFAQDPAPVQGGSAAGDQGDAPVGDPASGESGGEIGAGGLGMQMPPSPPRNALSFDTACATEEAIKLGSEVLDAASKAYASATGMVDESALVVKTPMGDQTMKASFKFGSGNDMSLDGDGFKVTAVGSTLYLEVEGAADKYLATEIKESVGKTLEEEIGMSMPIPQLGLRRGSSVSATFGLGLLENAKVAGFCPSVDGKPSQILLTGDNGDALLELDGSTGLFDKLSVVASPPGVGIPGLEIGVMVDFNPTFPATPPTIAFDPGTKTKCKDMSEMQPSDPNAPKALAIGAPAPDFSLATLDGTMVKLADLKGSIVVVDFWATWCGPCKKGLPVLNKFAQWVASSGAPVKVFAINVWENSEGADRQKLVSEFWTKGAYSFPTLVDESKDGGVPVAYGVSGIPATFVIDQNGNVASAHMGYSAKLDETLQAEIAKLTAPAAAPATK